MVTQIEFLFSFWNFSGAENFKFCDFRHSQRTYHDDSFIILLHNTEIKLATLTQFYFKTGSYFFFSEAVGFGKKFQRKENLWRKKCYQFKFYFSKLLLDKKVSIYNLGLLLSPPFNERGILKKYPWTDFRECPIITESEVFSSTEISEKRSKLDFSRHLLRGGSKKIFYKKDSS